MIAAIYSRILVATLCSLLALVSLASAECAWVLWSQPVGPAGWVHIAIDGWKDRETCDTEPQWEEAAKPPEGDEPPS